MNIQCLLPVGGLNHLISRLVQQFLRYMADSRFVINQQNNFVTAHCLFALFPGRIRFGTAFMSRYINPERSTLPYFAVAK